jgi:putative SOS response-associated peptidase YedK
LSGWPATMCTHATYPRKVDLNPPRLCASHATPLTLKSDPAAGLFRSQNSGRHPGREPTGNGHNDVGEQEHAEADEDDRGSRGSRVQVRRRRRLVFSVGTTGYHRSGPGSSRNLDCPKDLSRYAGSVCGRSTSTSPRDTLARLLDVDEVEAPELAISWNVAPTQAVYAVATSSGGARMLRALRWGLVPSWAKDPRIGSRLINARSENLEQRPAFRSLVSTRRALLPVSGFYEWRRPGPGSAGNKQPFYFHRVDGAPLVFAGLWDIWRDGEGRPLRSCTIITTAANSTMAPIHHRMPVVLPRGAWEEWLQPGPLGGARLDQLLAPAPDDLLDVHPVGSAVNSARNDGPELLSPVRLPDSLTLLTV